MFEKIHTFVFVIFCKDPELVLIGMFRNPSIASKLSDFVNEFLSKVDIQYTAPIQILQEVILCGDVSVMETIVSNLKSKKVLNDDVILCGVKQVIVHLASCWTTNNWKQLQSDLNLKQKRLKQLQCLITFVKKFGEKLDIRHILSGPIAPEIEKLLK
jgi:hypothetical protein